MVRLNPNQLPLESIKWNEIFFRGVLNFLMYLTSILLSFPVCYRAHLQSGYMPVAFILDLLHFFSQVYASRSLRCELLVQMRSSRNPTVQSLYVMDVKCLLGHEEASCQSVVSIHFSESCERKMLNFNFSA